MAYTTTDLSAAAQTTAATAGKPFILPAGRVGNGLSTHIGDTTITWDTNATATSDIAEADYPTSRLYDGHSHLKTRPNISSGSVSAVYLHIVTEIPTLDTIYIGGHNLNTAGANPTMTIEIADNAAYTSNLITLISFAGFSASKDARLCFFNLGPAGGGSTIKQYGEVTHARIKITHGTGNFTTKPEIGEIVLGTREQLSQRPDVPFDDQAFSSDAVDFRSKSGILTRYIRNTGQRSFAHRHSPTGSDAYGLDDLTTIRNWYKNTRRGVEPFIYVPDPTNTITGINGATSAAFVCHFDDPRQGLPLTGPSLREANINFSESAPFVDSEG
ncbi:MAG: hypothetical protein CMJ20_02535 [Phycisphaeraceae bacterium]|nr:hypothetical protein [Phycisphaeraceae bacterium]|tara:strand:- start:4114 stop:5100 length:987 start_codon:yes stop_codon:yes gene_type:complete